MKGSILLIQILSLGLAHTELFFQVRYAFLLPFAISSLRSSVLSSSALSRRDVGKHSQWLPGCNGRLTEITEGGAFSYLFLLLLRAPESFLSDGSVSVGLLVSIRPSREDSLGTGVAMQDLSTSLAADDDKIFDMTRCSISATCLIGAGCIDVSARKMEVYGCLAGHL